MTLKEVDAWIRGLIAADNLHAFYISTAWKKLSKEVLREQHYECQVCKAKGIYKKATTVHHKFYVRLFPMYALSKFVNGKINLIAICEECHYEEHHKKEPKGFTNIERW